MTSKRLFLVVGDTLLRMVVALSLLLPRMSLAECQCVVPLEESTAAAQQAPTVATTNGCTEQGCCCGSDGCCCRDTKPVPQDTSTPQTQAEEHTSPIQEPCASCGERCKCRHIEISWDKDTAAAPRLLHLDDLQHADLIAEQAMHVVLTLDTNVRQNYLTLPPPFFTASARLALLCKWLE